MEKEFVEYWNTHQKHLILNAPEKLRAEYLESTRLDSPVDWICFLLPIAIGIILQYMMKLQSEMLSMGITIVVIIILYVLMQMLKPRFSKKQTETEAIEKIKQYYYERYKKTGSLDTLEPWHD